MKILKLSYMELLTNLIDNINGHLEEARKSEPLADKVSGLFMFGHHIIRYSFRKRGCELEIYNSAKDRFLDNVAEHCQRRAIGWFNVDVDEPLCQVLADPGFRDESDYIRYRYG